MPIFWADLSDKPEQLLMARQAIDELRVSHPDSVQSNVKSVYMSPWKSHQLNAKLVPICQSWLTQAMEQAMQILYLVWLLLPWLQGLMALLLKCTLTHRMQRVMVAKR